MLRRRESLYRTGRQVGRQAGRQAGRHAGMSQLLKHAGLLSFGSLSSFENNHTLSPLLTVVGLWGRVAGLAFVLALALVLF